MKTRMILSLLLVVISLPLSAQRFGDIDPFFFSSGRYVFNFPADMDFMLTFIDQRSFSDDESSIVIVGGNYSKDFRHEGSVFAIITNGTNLNARMGSLSPDIQRLYEGCITADKKYLICGYKQIDGGLPEARLAKFLATDLLDRSFGTNGTIIVDNQTGRDDVGGVIVDESNPTQPQIYVNGSTSTGGTNSYPVWWKFNDDGSKVSAFGTNGRLIYQGSYGWAGFWHAAAFGNEIIGVGAADESAYMGILNPSTGHWKHYYNPASAPTNSVFEATGAITKESSILFSGINWNMSTSKGIGWLQYFADASSDRLTPDPVITQKFMESLATLESENDCTITGIFKPAIWKETEQTKQDNPANTGYVVAGTVEYESGPEQTFLACFDTNGEIYRDFGTGGFTVIDLSPGSWPVDMVYGDDGYIYVAMNGGDRYGYLYRIMGYRDLSGTGATDLTHSKMRLYPNPAEEELFVNMQLPNSTSAQLVIYDLLGKTVYSNEISLHAGVNTIRLELESLNKGNYILSLKAGDLLLRDKFIRK